jgi:hypothetical protein
LSDQSSPNGEDINLMPLDILDLLFPADFRNDLVHAPDAFDDFRAVGKGLDGFLTLDRIELVGGAGNRQMTSPSLLPGVAGGYVRCGAGRKFRG